MSTKKPISCKPPRRIPEGYGTRSIEAIQYAIKRGLKLNDDFKIVLPIGRVTEGRLTDGERYRSINISNGKGNGCKVTVARVVCYLHHGPPPHPSYVVDHIDGDSLNDHPSNLRWATYSENTLNNSGNREAGTTPQRIEACLAALSGIESPAGFMAAVRELRDTVKREGLVEVCRSARKLIAMLPPETAT